MVGLGVLPRAIAGLTPWLRAMPDLSQLDPRTREAARVARLLSGPAVRAARTFERPASWQVGAIFRRFDVLITPTAARPAMPVGAIDGPSSWQTDQRMVAYCPYTWPWNVLGWPAVNVPAGFVPVGR